MRLEGGGKGGELGPFLFSMHARSSIQGQTTMDDRVGGWINGPNGKGGMGMEWRNGKLALICILVPRSYIFGQAKS